MYVKHYKYSSTALKVQLKDKVEGAKELTIW